MPPIPPPPPQAIATVPDARRQGLCRLLLDSASDAVRAAGVPQLVVSYPEATQGDAEAKVRDRCLPRRQVAEHSCLFWRLAGVSRACMRVQSGLHAGMIAPACGYGRACMPVQSRLHAGTVAPDTCTPYNTPPLFAPSPIPARIPNVIIQAQKGPRFLTFPPPYFCIRPALRVHHFLKVLTFLPSGEPRVPYRESTYGFCQRASGESPSHGIFFHSEKDACIRDRTPTPTPSVLDTGRAVPLGGLLRDQCNDTPLPTVHPIPATPSWQPGNGVAGAGGHDLVPVGACL
eukprot:361438-Chlamydomonas_euryale.AAC.1